MEESPLLPSQQTATGAFYKADKVRTHTNGVPTTCSAQPAQSAWCLYATYMGLLYSIPVCVNLGYRACVKGGVALCPPPTVCVCVATFAWLLLKSGVY